MPDYFERLLGCRALFAVWRENMFVWLRVPDVTRLIIALLAPAVLYLSAVAHAVEGEDLLHHSRSGDVANLHEGPTPHVIQETHNKLFRSTLE